MKARILYNSDATDSSNSIKKHHDTSKQKKFQCMPPFNASPNFMEILKSFDCAGRPVRTKTEEEHTPDDCPDFDSLAKASAEYALKQTAADEAVGETCKYIDTTALRAELEILQSKVDETSKGLLASRSELSKAELERDELVRRSERAAENLRRAKAGVDEALASLETEYPVKSSGLEKRKQWLEKAVIKVDKIKRQLSANAELIITYKQEVDDFAVELYNLNETKADLEDVIRFLELPRFLVVPSNDCIVLMALNYNLYILEDTNDVMQSTIWSRKISRQFNELTDSERLVMGRLFAILSSLKGGYEVSIDKSLETANRIYEHFKGMLKG